MRRSTEPRTSHRGFDRQELRGFRALESAGVWFYGFG